ncbi:ATP-dependent DNA ligase [Leucobacter sp. USCH14]
MGSIRYDGLTIHFKEHLLAHMQVVIVQKIMRDESFLMSWKNGTSAGDGRTAIWIAPSTRLTFSFEESEMPDLDDEWLQRLGESANANTGMILTEKDGSLARAEAADTPYPGNLRDS